MQKKTLTKALAVVGLASAMALTPIAANAYVPTPTDEVVATIGSPITIEFSPIFVPGEPVTLTLTGFNGASQGLASAGAISTATATTTAEADGTADATVTFNNQASGEYTLTATGASGASETVTVIAAAPSTGGGTGGDDLAATGLDNSALGLWVGGGALLLGGGAVLVSRSVRKQQAKA